MARPENVRYMKSHEWACSDGDLVRVGISDHAVDMLNKEIVYVELPKIGRSVKQGDVFGTIESVKAASDLYAPVSGTVKEVNDAVVSNPALVADAPYGDGWMIAIVPDTASDLDALLAPADYETQIAGEEAH